MDLKKITIGEKSMSFLENKTNYNLDDINTLIFEKAGIVNFFDQQDDCFRFKQSVSSSQKAVSDIRAKYGDFQTNKPLTLSICHYLKSKNINPISLIEPTCGKGSFIISALQTFNSLQQIFGIEIQVEYLWHLKFEILEYFLTNPTAHKPKIYLYNNNIFDFDFMKIKKKLTYHELLIIGNPPWVTNSALSVLGSDNLPQKINFKNTNGIDAITGKGNFDIGEYITLKILNIFSTHNGHFAFLIKNSVIKNIVFEQKNNQYRISNLEKHNINAKKEFNAAVDASLFSCKLNTNPDLTAKEFDYYTLKYIAQLGWHNGKFASDIERHKKYEHLEGVCPYVWRQGIKHDCAKVMELERINGGFRNGLGEEFELEEDLVYGVLKSSDLKGEVIDKSRKYTIITQKKLGQNTLFLLEKFPKTKEYLHRHKQLFLNRKSSIYKGKPMFSIFGIGDYSFKPFKIAISGLYKQTKFTLIKPNEKSLLLDDTCYFIGFDDLEEAEEVHNFLNLQETQEFIKSFMFSDTKRVITKELLMRINISVSNSYKTTLF